MELIIKNKLDKRTRSSIVINIETDTRTEIERLAEASGHTTNEIIEMLIDFALPLCKLADEAKAEHKAEHATAPVAPPSSSSRLSSLSKGSKSTPVKTTPKTTISAKTITAPKTAPKTAPNTDSKSETVPLEEGAKEKPAPKLKTTAVHSAVPTFKLPPIAPTKTVSKTRTTSSKK